MAKRPSPSALKRPFGPLRGDRVAELVAVEVELDARPGDRLALRVDDAATDPRTRQEREPADVVVLAGEDADIVATLARQVGHVGPDGNRLVGLEAGQAEPPVGAAARGSVPLVVGNTPDRGPGDRTALQVDHLAGDRAGFRRPTGGLLIRATLDRPCDQGRQRADRDGSS